jgi:pyruvate formate lyase activating enzyme
MRIGGLQRLSLIDYPGKVAAIVFTRGCNLRCGYCHNPGLVLKECYAPLIPEDDVLSFLTNRRFHLQGVVITGGEPALQKDLISFIMKIKRLGLAVKLDTNGTFPNVLEEIIEGRLVDYLAMDIKTSLEKYHQLAGASHSVEDITRSIELIRACAIDHEFRTTAVKPLCAFEDLRKIRELIGPGEKHRIQEFQTGRGIIDPGILKENQYCAEDIYLMEQRLAKR